MSNQKSDEPIDLGKLLTATLTNPLKDPSVALQTIVNAIVDSSLDTTLVENAVKKTITNYENRLRVFMVAVANAHLPRIMNLMKRIDSVETLLESSKLQEKMDVKDLLKAYALMQGTLVQSLDYVKKIADMRIELQKAYTSMSDPAADGMSDVADLSTLPSLDVNQRNRVRAIIEGVIAQIKDSSEEEDYQSTGDEND